MSDTTIVVKKVISAARDEVFEAFTNADIMSKWFFPGEDMSAEVTNNLELGGSYTLKMHAKNGDVYTHVGEYKEITPPEKLVFTWNSDFVQNTDVTVTFVESGSGTEVTVSHDLLPNDEMRQDHRKGWTGCLNRLESIFGA
jgi:uncharacterized protein YndB with AHSA1/START domain